MKYEKSQIGWVMISVFGTLLSLLIIIRLTLWDSTQLPDSLFIIAISVSFLFLLLFYKLKIKIEAREIQVIFGIGVVKIKIKPQEISNVETIKVPWWYGWGIRLTPKGWLYNVNGNRAVYFNYMSDEKAKRVMLGTEDPENLIKALRANFGK